MIVVSGMPRAGTSMMMQTLHYLGVPLVGEGDFDFKGNSYLHRQNIPENMYEGILSHNPKGYWEIPLEYMFLYMSNYYEGEAIKLLGPVSISIPDQRNIECSIVCRRKDTARQARSAYDLIRKDVELRDYDVAKGILSKESSRAKIIDALRTLSVKDIEADITRGDKAIARWWLDHDTPYLTMYFEAMLDNPELGVKEVRNFLKLTTDIDKAIENIGVKNEVSF